MSPRNPLQKRAQDIVKTYLTPILRKAGFVKNGIVYTKSIGQIVHIVDIQQSPTNRIDEISFALNCGVHIPGVAAAFWKGPEPKQLEACVGILDVRPGMLLPVLGPQFWDLKSTDGPDRDAEVGRDIQNIVETAALPFFERFKTESTIAEFLSQPRHKQDRFVDPRCESLCYAYGGIIWNQLGEREKCRVAMAQAATLAKGKRLEADVEVFAKNFVCDGKQKAGTTQE